MGFSSQKFHIERTLKSSPLQPQGSTWKENFTAQGSLRLVHGPWRGARAQPFSVNHSVVGGCGLSVGEGPGGPGSGEARRGNGHRAHRVRAGRWKSGRLGGFTANSVSCGIFLMLVNRQERECLLVPAWEIAVETRVCALRFALSACVTGKQPCAMSETSRGAHTYP